MPARLRRHDSVERWLNPGAMIRDWLNARDVTRWKRCRQFPPTLERTYWSAYEYQRDLGRLQAHGYRLAGERNNRRDPAAAIDIAAPFFNRGGGAYHYSPRLRRFPLLYRVSYERLSWATWAQAVGPGTGDPGQ